MPARINHTGAAAWPGSGGLCGCRPYRGGQAAGACRPRLVLEHRDQAQHHKGAAQRPTQYCRAGRAGTVAGAGIGSLLQPARGIDGAVPSCLDFVAKQFGRGVGGRKTMGTALLGFLISPATSSSQRLSPTPYCGATAAISRDRYDGSTSSSKHIEKRRVSSGTPRSRCAPRSWKVRVEPAAKARTVPDTTISQGSAIAAMRAAMWTAMPVISLPLR